jgi:hypothetical protein
MRDNERKPQARKESGEALGGSFLSLFYFYPQSLGNINKSLSFKYGGYLRKALIFCLSKGTLNDSFHQRYPRKVADLSERPFFFRSQLFETACIFPYGGERLSVKFCPVYSLKK